MAHEPASDSEQRTEHSFYNFIDGHLRELRWTAYSLAGLGVFLVLRRVKATTKFTHVSNIPKHFFSKNYRLQGKVRNVSECGQLLVEHVPIIRLNLFTSDAESNHLLAVNVAGVSVTPEAVQWLRRTAQDQSVWFRLLQANDASVDCDVLLKLVITPFLFYLTLSLLHIYL
ncbi:hypothetical protein PoB_001418100 [Plakobranchus ocellatus]|uniref:Uncharacterized protein n=1 Tax=Plakobranchus ocellatus TaxID=259542 RepID=A0AAV3YW22_9GAST|nr:hypothetical protein PoB_001418100 [Plakobranchus ocellatus]